MADYLKMAREWEKSRKNKVDDKTLLSLFSQATNELDKIYPPGCLWWLEQNEPELDKRINETEEHLRGIWYKCREGKATLDEFKEALEGYKRAVMEGVRAYRTRINR